MTVAPCGFRALLSCPPGTPEKPEDEGRRVLPPVRARTHLREEGSLLQAAAGAERFVGEQMAYHHAAGSAP